MDFSKTQNNYITNTNYDCHLVTNLKTPTDVLSVTQTQYHSHNIYISLKPNNNYDNYDQMNYFHYVALLLQTPDHDMLMVTPDHTTFNTLPDLNYDTGFCCIIEKFEKNVGNIYAARDQYISTMKKHFFKLCYIQPKLLAK